MPVVSAPARRATSRSELVLHCTPPDAEVGLDSVPQGACDDYAGSPKGLQLKAGPHRVEVKKPGYAPWESFMEADGTRMVMDVTLIPNSNRESTP
jgi:hypothetical protein